MGTQTDSYVYLCLTITISYSTENIVHLVVVDPLCNYSQDTEGWWASKQTHTN